MRAARWLAGAATWIYYRVERQGPPLPPGPVLLVANHANALLDPAVIWTTAGRDVRFLAKAPLFDVPLFGAILRASGAIPVYRSIDAADTSRNADMFAAVRAELAAGDAVCLFPEGTSHSTGRLEPLRTGAARMALEARDAGIDVAIVPVGLNFDRKSAFRSRATVAFGRPLDRRAMPRESDRDAVRTLTGQIAHAMRMVLVEVDPVADAALVDRIERLYLSARPEAGDGDRVERRRLIAAGLTRLRGDNPAWYSQIAERVRTYDARLARVGLRDRDLDGSIHRSTAARFAIREGLIAIALGPLMLAGFALFLVPYHLTDWIAGRARYLDEAATIKVFAGGAIYLLWLAAIALVVWWAIGAAGALLTLALLPMVAFASLAAIERESTVLAAVRGYLAARRTSARARAALGRRRNEIVDVLDEIARWVSIEVSGQSRETSARADASTRR
jgi:glycerol-3-phosphate O-acyltransferase / dihydroxyacetone phosphate acyltransferase